MFGQIRLVEDPGGKDTRCHAGSAFDRRRGSMHGRGKNEDERIKTYNVDVQTPVGVLQLPFSSSPALDILPGASVGVAATVTYCSNSESTNARLLKICS